MKKINLLKMALPICAASILTVSCVVYPREPVATAGTEVDVYGDPPAPIVEEITPSPGIGFVWIGGAWAWHDHWVWEAGRWDRPPHPGAVWVPHRYVYHNGRHIFIQGGWR
jgi:hypothetical protein